ncbi:hypothetical protein [Acinetobacter sp. YH12120]|nr:hypothetical protein [Acinetobacter sp. YH12120]
MSPLHIHWHQPCFVRYEQSSATVDAKAELLSICMRSRFLVC